MCIPSCISPGTTRVHPFDQSSVLSKPPLALAGNSKGACDSPRKQLGALEVPQMARLLLHSGFRPDEAVGQVRHSAAPHRPGRTFGSVWREMRRILGDESPF